MEENTSEFKKFDRTMDELLKASSRQIKENMAAERKAKAERKERRVTSGRKSKRTSLTRDKGESQT